MTKTHSRGYTVELREEEDGSWSALVPELPGAVAVGDTPNEAVEDLPDVIDLWIATARERNMAVPEPRVDSEVSGRTLLRMPKDLHRALTNRARIEGVSLNTYCVSVLSVAIGEALGRRTRQLDWDIHLERSAAIIEARTAGFGASATTADPSFNRVLHDWTWLIEDVGLVVGTSHKGDRPTRRGEKGALAS